MARINIEVNDDLHYKAREAAFKLRMTLIQFVTEAVDTKIKSVEEKK